VYENLGLTALKLERREQARESVESVATQSAATESVA
jgi:hypothetical protein